MRPVWTTLVAIALVVAGTRAGGPPAGRTGHRELHAAKHLHVAPSVRHAPRPLDALVATAAIALPAVSRQVVVTDAGAAIVAPRPRPSFVRSSRGPPRA